MNKRIFSIFILLYACFAYASAQIQEPVKWEISISKIETNGDGEITFKAIIADKWHIYGTDLPQDGPLPTRFAFESMKNVDLVGKTKSKSKLLQKFEATFNMTLNWYENEAIFVQKIKANDINNYKISGYVEYMACNDNTCLPPAREEFNFGHSAPAQASASAEKTTVFPIMETGKSDIGSKKKNDNSFWKPVTKELEAYGQNEGHATENESLWSIFLKGIIGGLLAIITPCVWPIIPMTVSFFLRRGKDPKKGKKAAIVYGISIVLIYETLGLLITLISGASALNGLSTNAIFNVVLFAMLVLFSISFFGGFDLALPATWSTKIDKTADKTAGIFSILLMALTLVIVSFSCTGLIIGTLLVSVSSSNILAPAIGMFGFALALAAPFTIFALFPSWLHNLPRSGGWLNSVKVILGFLELAFALKFFSVADLAYGWNLLDREVFLVLWIVIFSFLGLYILGKIRFAADDKIEHVSVVRLFLSIVAFSFVAYLIPGLFGAPLKAVSAFAPPLSTQDFNLYDGKAHAQFEDYDQGMEYAEKYGKPVVVDFSGYGCVNCRKMEVSVWSDPEVSKLLTDDYVLISLYVDDKKELAHPYTVTENGKERKISTWGEKWSYLQRSKFGANAQPYYVLLNNEGNVINHAFAFSENKYEFISFLRTGLKNFDLGKQETEKIQE
ncbi:MAG: cytochrome c biogenesis protein CcdA [Paludibacteraceae bacterium]